MKKFKGHQTRLNISKKPSFLKTIGYTAIMILLMTSIISSLVPTDVFAISNRFLPTYGHGNSVERAYYDSKDYTAGVWVSAPGSSYGSTGVNVYEGQSSINVVVRGSWSPRKREIGNNSMNFQGVYANLKTSGTYPVTGGGTRSGSQGLTLTGGKMFYRGDMPSNTWGTFYVRNIETGASGRDNGQVPARLDVSGVCDGKYGQAVTKSVYIASVFTVKPLGGGAPVIYGDYNYDRTDIRLNCIARYWDTAGTTSVNRSTATIGQTVTWHHTVRNIGLADVTYANSAGRVSDDRGIFVNVDRRYYDSSGNMIGGQEEFNKAYGAFPKAGETFIDTNSQYVVDPDNRPGVIGGRVCERLAWVMDNNIPNDGRDGKNDWRFTPWACVAIPYQYEVYPNLQINAGAVQPGSELTGDVNLYNQGNTDQDIDWTVSRVVINQSQTGSFDDNFDELMAVAPNWRYGEGNQSGSGIDVCAWISISPGGYDCDNTSVGGSAEADRNTITQADTVNLTIPTSADYGDMVCFVLGIRGGSSTSSSTRRFARSNCMLLSKSPKVQVWGGDLRSAGSIATSQTAVNDKIFGSWGEYGVMSSLNNSLMASAGNYQGGASTSAELGRLTFANRAESGLAQSGDFGSVPHMSLRNQFLGDSVMDLANRGQISQAARDVGSLSSGVYEAAGTLRLSGDLPQNRTIVIRPATNSDGSLRDLRIIIEDDIRASTASIGNIERVPQLIIVASDIDIREDVRWVDAWLLASDNINTCANGASRLTTNMCDRLLTVNGPVETDTISLRRTGGSGTTDDGARSDPAEVFNLRADASVWLYSESADGGAPITVNVRELPPRF